MSNPYFNFFNQNSNEFNLYNNISDEICETYGIDCYYMIRQNVKDDFLFGDAVGSYFNDDNSFAITMYLENPLDMENDETFSKFGLSIDNKVNFIVQQQRIHQAIGNRPFSGDLIYCPNVLHGRVFEVIKSEEKYNLYAFGKLSTYKIVTKLLELSDESFNTSYSELNGLNATTSISASYSDNISPTTATLYIDFSEPFNF